MTKQETREHFNSIGFEHHCYSGGDGSETWSDLNGMFVHISPCGNYVELSTIDGLVHCTTQRIGFPNRNLNVFINNLRRHVSQ